MRNIRFGVRRAALGSLSLTGVAAMLACGGDAAVVNGGNPNPNAACDTDNGGITLPSGFCATVFADHVGAARHVAVSSDGIVYVMISGGSILALRDTNADGHSDLRASFGRSGGTGVAIRGTDLWADVQSAILRYHLVAGQLQPAGNPDTIVKSLPTGGDHGARNIAIDGSGNLFVNVGSSTNVCGQDPCGELTTRAAIWRFNADQVGQAFSSGERFATGIRNAVGLAVNPGDGRLYATQHGRDDLYQNYSGMFTAQDGAENPAEELVQVNRGDDFGWPYCYYDFRASQVVLGPEYGGDRQKVGRCSTAKAPLTAFPGHWAPDGLLIYSGTAFPSHYRNGAFVAFHGSWNRAPLPQAGFRVAFVASSGSSLSSSYETFADGFAGGTVSDPGAAAHRPTGLAMGPDGALFVTDDQAGRIWRIVYRGQ
jgi:glucose/arabinose dehydrogenase